MVNPAFLALGAANPGLIGGVTLDFGTRRAPSSRSAPNMQMHCYVDVTPKRTKAQEAALDATFQQSLQRDAAERFNAFVALFSD